MEGAFKIFFFFNLGKTHILSISKHSCIVAAFYRHSHKNRDGQDRFPHQLCRHLCELRQQICVRKLIFLKHFKIIIATNFTQRNRDQLEPTPLTKIQKLFQNFRQSDPNKSNVAFCNSR
jgi:hypothetical protein